MLGGRCLKLFKRRAIKPLLVLLFLSLLRRFFFSLIFFVFLFANYCPRCCTNCTPYHSAYTFLL